MVNLIPGSIKNLSSLAKRRLVGIIIWIITFSIMLLQIFYEFIPLSTSNSKRYYAEILFIAIALGVGLQYRNTDKIVKYSLLSWILINGIYLIMGGGWVNDVIGLAEVDLTGIDHFLLAVGEGWGDQISSVVNAVVLAVPAVILIVGVITIFGAEDSNEYQEAMIEIGLAIVLLAVYGTVKYFIG